MEGRTEREGQKPITAAVQAAFLSDTSVIRISGRKRGTGPPRAGRCVRPGWVQRGIRHHSAWDSLQLCGVAGASVSEKKKRPNQQAPDVVWAPRAPGVASVHVSSCPVARSRSQQPGASPDLLSQVLLLVS